jgi:NTE family protein
MLRALCAHDVRPDLVAGSSVGAINGAFYAGTPTASGIGKLESLWRGLRRQDIFPVGLSSLFGALVNSNHLFDPGGLRGLLTAHLPYARLEDSAIPIQVMATDLLTGASVNLSSGPAVAAILASCAIPAIYPPVEIDDRQLIDGAIACNTPIRTAVESGATRVIILPTAFACPHAASPRGIFRSAFHAMGLFVMQQLDQDTRLFANRAEIVMVPPICPLAVRPYDFSRAGQMIDLAARSTERWLESNGLPGGEALRVETEQSGTPVLVAATHTRHGNCTANLPSCVPRKARRRGA